MTEPRIFRVLFPHANYEINENTGEQTVPMVDMGLMKMKGKEEPSYDIWAKLVSKTGMIPKIYFNTKKNGVIKNWREFEKTIKRARRQPELISFEPETLEEWEAA